MMFKVFSGVDCLWPILEVEGMALKQVEVFFRSLIVNDPVGNRSRLKASFPALSSFDDASLYGYMGDFWENSFKSNREGCLRVLPFCLERLFVIFPESQFIDVFRLISLLSVDRESDEWFFNLISESLVPALLGQVNSCFYDDLNAYLTELESQADIYFDEQALFYLSSELELLKSPNFTSSSPTLSDLFEMVPKFGEGDLKRFFGDMRVSFQEVRRWHSSVVRWAESGNLCDAEALVQVEMGEVPEGPLVTLVNQVALSALGRGDVDGELLKMVASNLLQDGGDLAFFGVVERGLCENEISRPCIDSSFMSKALIQIKAHGDDLGRYVRLLHAFLGVLSVPERMYALFSIILPFFNYGNSVTDSFEFRSVARRSVPDALETLFLRYLREFSQREPDLFEFWFSPVSEESLMLSGIGLDARDIRFIRIAFPEVFDVETFVSGDVLRNVHVVHNSGRGDCLFYALRDGSPKHGPCDSFIDKDVDDIRAFVLNGVREACSREDGGMRMAVDSEIFTLLQMVFKTTAAASNASPHRAVLSWVLNPLKDWVLGFLDTRPGVDEVRGFYETCSDLNSEGKAYLLEICRGLVGRLLDSQNISCDEEALSSSLLDTFLARFERRFSDFKKYDHESMNLGDQATLLASFDIWDSVSHAVLEWHQKNSYVLQGVFFQEQRIGETFFWDLYQRLVADDVISLMKRDLVSQGLDALSVHPGFDLLESALDRGHAVDVGCFSRWFPASYVGESFILHLREVFGLVVLRRDSEGHLSSFEGRSLEALPQNSGPLVLYLPESSHYEGVCF